MLFFIVWATNWSFLLLQYILPITALQLKKALNNLSKETELQTNQLFIIYEYYTIFSLITMFVALPLLWIVTPTFHPTSTITSWKVLLFCLIAIFLFECWSVYFCIKRDLYSLDSQQKILTINIVVKSLTWILLILILNDAVAYQQYRFNAMMALMMGQRQNPEPNISK